MSDRRTMLLEAATRVIARRGVRGLRVEELAKEAGVSTSLLYYHFEDRAGLLRQTLEFVSKRADRYTTPTIGARGVGDPRREIEETLLLELQDSPAIRENSTAWGELRASAVFDPDLREPLTAATDSWVSELVGLVRTARPKADALAVAERLTALVEGLSERWLSGSMTLDRARELLRGAIAVELD